MVVIWVWLFLCLFLSEELNQGDNNGLSTFKVFLCAGRHAVCACLDLGTPV